jgi:hypothetical protein
MNPKKQLSIRLNPDAFAKLQYIAGQEERTKNGQIVFLINSYIRGFEKAHGKIEMNPKAK